MIPSHILHRGRTVAIPEEIQSRYREGDQVFVTDSGSVLHVSAEVSRVVEECVVRASGAAEVLRSVSDDRISAFFERAANLLASDDVRRRLLAVNEEDRRRAVEAGRSVTRLVLDTRMIDGMVDSFKIWAGHPVQRDVVVEEIDHGSWSVSRTLAPLGVIGFVFEGRPNVVVDACGVLVTGNTCVFRIGRDARRTAEEIVALVVEPALRESSLPPDGVVLIPIDDHAGGWSLFANQGISLAVARGSGRAVQDLGSVARQSGVAVSLHGRGGAWFLVGESAEDDRLYATLKNSLDRKVCNTANVVCLPRSQARSRFATVCRALREAAVARDTTGIIHLVGVGGSEIGEAESIRVVPAAVSDLRTEWEWENDPEITVCFVDTFEEATNLFNEYSARLVASVITESDDEQRLAWDHLVCPFVGDGFSRWVDGQFAFRRPELGLSNWESGIPLGRGAVLSGSDIHSVRYRARQRDLDLHR